MDNDKATHDLHRKFKNGCGTYEQVIKGLKSIFLLSPTIRSTVTPYLLNIRKPLISSVPFFIDFTYELFLQKNLIPQIKQLLFQMLGIFCDDLYKGCYVVCKENLTVYQVIKRYAFFHNRQFFCDSMLHGIAVDKDGLFYPCHRFCTNRSFNIGNIHSGLDEKRVIDFLSVISIQNNDTCNVCWAQNICGGFCPYVNFSLFGNYQKRNYELCGVFKDFYQEVLKLFLSLTDQEKIALGLTHNIKT